MSTGEKVAVSIVAALVMGWLAAVVRMAMGLGGL